MTDRFRALGGFVTVLAANGASTALSFAASLLFARRFSPEAFATMNIVIVGGTVLAMASLGIDSTVSRLVAADPDPRRSAVERTREGVVPHMLLLAVGAPVLALYLALSSAVRESELRHEMAAATAVAVAVALTVVQLRIAAPQALRDFRIYGGEQVLFYAVVFAAALVAAMRGLSLDEALIVIFVLMVAQLPRRANLNLLRVRRPSGSFLELAPTLLFGSLVFALFDRLDLLVATAALPAGEAGQYGAALRIAGGMALATAALGSFILASASAAKSRRDLVEVYRQAAPAIVVVCVAAAAGIALASVITRVLLPPRYGPSSGLLRLLLLQFPLIALYTPAVIALPLVGRRRWHTELALVLLLTKVAVLLVVRENAALTALSATVAYAVGIAYCAFRLRSAATVA